MTRTFTLLGKNATRPASLAFRLFFVLFLLVLSAGKSFSQTTWTGNVDTNWNTAGNWSAGVPGASSDVSIPDVTNDPVIASGGAVAKSVTIASGGLLTVQASASLAVNGSVGSGIVNQGTVQNSGTINIGNVSGLGSDGIQNNGTFNNTAGALITVDNAVQTGIQNLTGAFTNGGTIQVGTSGNVGSTGIYSEATFTNSASGQIQIDRAWNVGFRVHAGATTNQGSISIGASATTDLIYGVNVYLGTFTNAGGQVYLDRCGMGVAGFDPSGNFLNSGLVKIGALQSVPDLIGNEDLMELTFTNNAGGVLQGSGNIPAARFVSAGGTLSPGYSPGKQIIVGTENLSNSIMAIEVNGTGVAGIAYDQIVVNGTATLGGTLNLSINYTPAIGDQVTILSASAISGTFGTVTGLPENWTINYTTVDVKLIYGGTSGNIWNGSVSSDWHDAANWSSGVPDSNSEVFIPDVTNDPAIYASGAAAKSVKVEAGAMLTVTLLGSLSVNGAAAQGIWNQGTIQNTGSINIGNTSNVGNYGIYNEGILNNNVGARIKINRVATSGIELSSGTLTNIGEIIIGDLVPVSKLITAFNGQFNNSTEGILEGTGEIAAANFTNTGGTLSPGYSPGKMTFTADENFNNNTLSVEVNGPATAGVDFDQVIVNGTATMGGTLHVAVNYPASIGDQIIIVSASQVTGNFSSVVGLPAGWHVVYYPTQVLLNYGTPQTTWTGNLGTDWHTAGNWSSGVPDFSSDVTIPDVANDPVIGSGGATAKSVTITSGGLLTIESAGGLSIQGSYASGIFNQGTINNKGTTAINGSGSTGIANEGSVQNSGTINIGNVSGLDGIQNNGTFNNTAGALITVDNGVQTGIQNLTGAFTNGGTIQVGASGNVGSTGIYSEATFTNSASGQIQIDRAWNVGFRVHAGATTNQGSISIGASATTDLIYGINVYLGTFTNAGGQVYLDRCDMGVAGFDPSGNFLNSGLVKIGALQNVPDLIGNEDLMELIFTNNAGGVLQGSGNIPAARFASAGGTLSPGYSPGKQTIDGSENLSNGTMAIEVNGTGVAGIAYDQIVVNGTATLGGTLALTFNFPAPKDGDVVTIIDAVVLSGTFSSVTGLPEHWAIKYNSPNAGEVSLEYSNAMPVTLISFTVKKQENVVKLDWQTSEESNNQGFEIERRADKGNWENIGFVDGNGTTKAKSIYNFLDMSPLSGMNYYRLRQVDFDGKTELSRIVGVKMASEQFVKVYPNPTTGIVHIEGARSPVEIRDILGKPVMKGRVVNQKIDISGLPTGLYILSVSPGSNGKPVLILKQ